jgi:hypothetical protein
VVSSLCVALEYSRKTYAEAGRDDRGHGDSGGIQTILVHLNSGRSVNPARAASAALCLGALRNRS